MRRAAETLAHLANPQRLHILCQLVYRGELSVGQINEPMKLSQSALSQHLARLRENGFVATRREAQTIYYRIQREDVYEILKTLQGLYGEQNQSRETNQKKQP